MRRLTQCALRPVTQSRAAMSSLSNPIRIEYISGAYKFNSDLTKKYGSITLENSFQKDTTQLKKGDILFSPESLHKSLMNETTADLIRSYGVLEMSRINGIVENGNKLLTLSKTVLGNSLTNALLKSTIYKQFLGGETDSHVKLLIDYLQTKNIGSIVDYAVEADISDEATVESYSFDPHNNTISFLQGEKLLYTTKICDEEMGSFSVEKDKYKNHLLAFMKSIDIASLQCDMPGIVAIKVSSMCDPNHLNKINTHINKLQSVFNQFADEEELMNFEGFVKALEKLCTDESLNCDENALRKHFHQALQIQHSTTTKLNYYQWMEWLNPKKNIKQLKLNLKTLDTMLAHELNLVRARLNHLCEYAEKKNVLVLVDAEQTYYQDAIHTITLELIQKYNTQQCRVYNTYQAYLKETLRKYLDDLDWAANSKTPFLLGAKLVRGAYLEKERELASYFGTESPVCDNYDETNLSFLRCLVAMVDSIHNNNGAGVVATHNLDSIKYTIDLMDTKNIQPNDNRIIFSQLYGMCSFISNILAENKLRVYKYLPYGPIDYVMPYMLRRINENKSVLARLGLETTIIRNELVRRAKKTNS